MTARHTIPTQVLEALTTAGTLGRNGIGRKAQLRTCPRCRRWIIIGDDHHRTAIRVELNPVTLDPLAEALALLAGTPTYELWGREIEQRDQWRIRAGQHRPVLAAHQCGADNQPPDPAIIATFIPPITTPTHTDERPPF